MAGNFPGLHMSGCMCPGCMCPGCMCLGVCALVVCVLVYVSGFACVRGYMCPGLHVTDLNK